MNTPEHASRGHHPTSPSSLQTLEASPCYTSRQNSDNEAAERGTKQHESSDAGEIHEELSDEEAYAVAQTLEATSEAIRELGGDDAVVVKEKYWRVDNIEVTDDTGHRWTGTTGGYADVAVFNKEFTRGICLDWKFGKYSVEPAETNLQGIAYALGMFHEYPTLEEVTVAFYSPHIDDYTQHTFTRADVPAMYLRVKVVVARARETRVQIANDPRVMESYHPRIGSCTFCGRIATCPAVVALALNIADKYKPIDGPPPDIRGFALIDPEVASYGIQLGQVVAAWAAEYRARVTSKAVEDERFIPDGYQLSVSYPRKVVDLDAAIQVSEAHLSEEEVKGMLSLPITTVEKAVAAKAPRGQKTTAVEEFAKELEDAGAVEKSSTPVICLRMKSDKNK